MIDHKTIIPARNGLVKKIQTVWGTVQMIIENNLQGWCMARHAHSLGNLAVGMERAMHLENKQGLTANNIA